MVFRLVLLLLSVRSATPVYFSMADIEVNLPSDESKLLAENYPLLTLYAHNNLTSRSKNHFSYVFRPKSKSLTVFHPEGDVLLTEHFHRNIKSLGAVRETVSVEDKYKEEDSTTLQVNVTPMEKLDCDLILRDLCFWFKVTYRVMEESRALVLGSLSPQYLLQMCPGYKLNYTIKGDTQQFKLMPPEKENWQFWRLQSPKALIKTSEAMVKLDVICNIENKQGSARDIENTLRVEILDRDNNPPIPQYEEIPVRMNKKVWLKDELLHHNDLIFTDEDNPQVNSYSSRVLGEASEFLMPECLVWGDTRNNKNATAVHCKIRFTRTHVFAEDEYQFTLLLNDTSLRTKRSSPIAAMRISLEFGGGNEEEEANARPLQLYPERVVKIFRSAGPLARLTQPKHLTDQSSFSISSNSEKKLLEIFNITSSEGILFVHKIKYLRKAPEFIRLNISWNSNQSENRDYDEIKIRIIEESTKTCLNTTNWTWCSRFQYAEDCLSGTKGCAIGTGGSSSVKERTGTERCKWRGQIEPGNEITHQYSTCTPDVHTCPDGICDSLESLHRHICPQDCTTETVFPTKLGRKGKGIDIGHGVCSCDQKASCQCNLQKRRAKPTSSTSPPLSIPHVVSKPLSNNTTGIINTALARCGMTCVLGIIAGVVFLVGTVAFVVICWRLGKVRGKFNDDGQEMAAPLSDYIDRSVTADPLPLNFQMTTSLVNPTAMSIINKYQPDAKWEFPRAQLTIEQTLGEGEFGRVMRAKALDIAGQPGRTTVAVKTLKDDARESELNDLLSEYQLLKEVSHPNVIRLLGVCTSPGGPVYLIIEFAEYGSLRNYLRRSRHLKSEVQGFPISARGIDDGLSHYDEPNVSKITPKEILSFAWQICNGMAYLNDIKFVHRDLAARNVLLTSDKVCKISDFGLTRDIYEDNAYFKRSKGRVPVKWMAPESLSHHVYTSKSDVWSFGILIWELVTLGATPYPGIAVQNLFHLLKQGYRMERPDNCSPALYNIMRSCWNLAPEDRPSFKELAACWEKMLEDGMEYLDLTNNSIHNRSYFCSPFEEGDKESVKENGSVNYLSKCESFEKSSASDKLLKEEEMKSDDEENDLNKLNGTQDYESPVKVAIKGEGHQEYTDMRNGVVSHYSN